MARGKFEAKKRGTGNPPAQVNRGVGSRLALGVLEAPRLPGSSGPEPAGRGSDLPALGIVVMSPWGWRILAVATMVAVGLCVTFILDGHSALGGIWAFVGLAWGFFSFKLWRMHLDWDLRH
jgi:hypothetical protein